MGAALPVRGDIPAAELRRLARLEGDGRVACRLLALANALDGMSRERAAKQAGLDRQTLRDWVVRFNAEGVGGLRDRQRLLHRLDQAPQRARPHPLTVLLRLARHGQNLTGLV
jgi:transposase